jgi:hypothetical protein
MRFPPSEFLEALDIIDPQTWIQARDIESCSSTSSIKNSNQKESRLNTSFLSKCDVLQNIFKELLSRESLRAQFEDFITEHYSSVINMKEPRFLEYVINLPLRGYYDDFIL